MTSIDLDLLVLALVQSGLATTYDLKSIAGLSVGSTAPILARLEQAGLVEAPEPGIRSSRRFTITKAGKKYLSVGWEELLDRQPTDVDEILRITYLAWALGSPEVASRFVEKATAGLQDSGNHSPCGGQRAAARSNRTGRRPGLPLAPDRGRGGSSSGTVRSTETTGKRNREPKEQKKINNA